MVIVRIVKKGRGGAAVSGVGARESAAVVRRRSGPAGVPGLTAAGLVLALAAGMLPSAALPEAATNTWLGRNTAWAEAANWSSGAAPAPSSTQDVLIPAMDSGTYPALAANAGVGGSLRLGEGARLALNGHDLDVGAARAAAAVGEDLRSDVTWGGLTIAGGASLLAEPGGATITLHAGGLASKGAVSGAPRLHVAGAVRGFSIRTEKLLELAELATAPSPFPYPVAVEGPVTVRGDLDLAGGRFLLKVPAAASGARFVVQGDLVFRGREPQVILVTGADLLLHGTIRSEGSAYCVESSGEECVWNKNENTGECRLRDNAGWVCMIGDGDQAITPGGLLPAIRIAKPSGRVTATADLQCNGLDVTRGSTLDLSKGQKLILGHFLRECARNPERNGIPAYGPCRNSRDLMNEGTIIGAPGVPLQFCLNSKGTRYAVDCVYTPPEPSVSPADAGLNDTLYKSVPWAAPGALSINRYASRLRLKDGRLFLDGQPCATGAKPGREAEPDRLPGLMDDSKPAGGKSAAGARAAVTRIAMKTVAEEFHAPDATPLNIAPLVARIVTPVRQSTVFAVNGPFWGNRDLYGTVDGDPDVGAGGAPYYDFVFPEAVTVGAVRLRSGTPINEGCQFVLQADTTGSGVCDRVLAWTCDGPQTNASSWMSWGSGSAGFVPAKVYRLRLQVLGPDGIACRAAVNEFEIYADRDSADCLARRPDAPRPEVFPGQARFLTPGDPVEAKWPDPKPDCRVCRIVAIAFWMAGVSWSATTDEAAYEKMPPLRQYEPCVTFLDEVKDRYRFDAVTVFFEGESVGFPWPSTNFLSSLNANYLSRRKTALAMRAAAKPKTSGDAIADALEAAPADNPGGDAPAVLRASDAKYSETLRIEDLRCQRNLLKEFCEAAHGKGLAVYTICRPEDMGKLYIGPRGQDAYEAFLKECAAAGVDGVSLTPDEEHPLWQCGANPRRVAFEQRTKAKSPDASLAERRRRSLERSEVAGLCMQDRMESIRKIKPDCRFYVDGARLLNGGDPDDIIWHTAAADDVGCSYQSHLVPRWAAATKNRRVAMGEYTSRTVRYNLESLLLGARMIRSYRFNYIELAKSEDQRIRENLFMDRFVRWGGTRPARPPTALLVSRASEAWWPEDCAAGRVKPGDSDRCWTIEEILYEFLLKNGYTFDVYYLDQAEDLAALKDYRLVILPFAYSVSRAAFDRMDMAYKAGANFLVGERQGEVDEFGQPYEKPLLAEWVAQGRQAGRIGVPAADLAALETSRSFLPGMAAIVDPLLGPHKDLTLWRYGNRIEGLVRAVSPREQYVSFINWEDKDASFEAGLTLPDGQYKIATLSSARPDSFREGRIDGQKTASAETLRRFALQLSSDEALSLYVAPADRQWGQQ